MGGIKCDGNDRTILMIDSSGLKHCSQIAIHSKNKNVF